MSIEEDLKNRDLWESGFQTSDGRLARILADDISDLQGRSVAVAIMEEYGREWVTLFTPQGMWSGTTRTLIRRPVKRRGWVNVYECNFGATCGAEVGAIHSTRDDADRRKGADRIACIEIEFLEGEGLEQ